MNEAQVKGSVKLFACGGGGLNIGARFEKHRGRNEVGFATIDTVYVDTSRSNLSDKINAQHLYLLDGMDGSGKVRSENYAKISEHIKHILQTHKPGDLNVILSTAAGGSGSVIGPSLASELMDRGLPVVVIAVGSIDTRLDAENTLKTLKSYEGVAKLRQAPVIMSYIQNGAGVTRAEADNHVESVITSLCALYSRENRELDSRDLFNFLRFERVTSFMPQLATLTLIDAKSSTEGLGNIITVATLATDENNTSFTANTIPEYQCVGFLPDNAEPAVLRNSPLHFVTSDGVIGGVAANIQAVLKQLSENQSARLKNGGLLTSVDSTTDSGLVL